MQGYYLKFGNGHIHRIPQGHGFHYSFLILLFDAVVTCSGETITMSRNSLKSINI
jgi:hypothetical protein